MTTTSAGRAVACSRRSSSRRVSATTARARSPSRVRRARRRVGRARPRPGSAGAAAGPGRRGVGDPRPQPAGVSSAASPIRCATNVHRHGILDVTVVPVAPFADEALAIAERIADALTTSACWRSRCSVVDGRSSSTSSPAAAQQRPLDARLQRHEPVRAAGPSHLRPRARGHVVDRRVRRRWPTCSATNGPPASPCGRARWPSRRQAAPVRQGRGPPGPQDGPPHGRCGDAGRSRVAGPTGPCGTVSSPPGPAPRPGPPA